MYRYKVCNYCESLVDMQDENSLYFPESNLCYCDDNCYRKEEKREAPEDIKRFNENYKE